MAEAEKTVIGLALAVSSYMLAATDGCDDDIRIDFSAVQMRRLAALLLSLAQRQMAENKPCICKKNPDRHCGATDSISVLDAPRHYSS